MNKRKLIDALDAALIFAGAVAMCVVFLALCYLKATRS